MKLLLGTAAATLLIVGGATSASAATRRADLATQLDRRVPGLLRHYRTAGAAVAMVRDGRVAWMRGYGFADRAHRVPVTPDTDFLVGSVSKPVTAWGVARLAAAGRVDLDAPVEPQLEGWRFPRSRFDPTGVTPRRLLSHTAGVSGTSRIRLTHPPGAGFHYSEGGYAVLQRLVEVAARRPFDDVMQSEVLRPLGMSSSGFARTPAIEARSATPYSSVPHRLRASGVAVVASDGLYTTAADFARFVAASPTMPELLRPAPQTSGAETLSARSGYGLGYFMEPLRAGDEIAWHPGVTPGWASMFALRPREGDGIVVLTNSDTGIHVAADATCLWSRTATGHGLQFCRSLRRGRGVTVALASGLAAGAIGWAAWLGFGLVRGRRSLAWLRHHPWRRVAGALVAVAAVAGWCALWHTDLVPARVWHDEIAPAALLPARFLWLTVLLVAGSLGLIVLGAMTEPARRWPRSRRGRVATLGFISAAGLVWWLTWHTDLAARVLLAADDVVPLRMLPAAARWVPWTVEALCAVAILRTVRQRTNAL